MPTPRDYDELHKIGDTRPDDQGPKFTDTEREEIKDHVARLDRMRWSQTDIARHLSLSQSTVSVYLKRIREEYKNSQAEMAGEEMERILAGFGDVRAHAYMCWLNSGRDKERRLQVKELKPIVNQEPVSPKKDKRKDKANRTLTKLQNELQVVKETYERESREPGAEWLVIIMKTFMEEAKLRGLYIEQKGDAPKVILDWGSLYNRSNYAPGEAEIEATIAAVGPPTVVGSAVGPPIDPNITTATAMPGPVENIEKTVKEKGMANGKTQPLPIPFPTKPPINLAPPSTNGHLNGNGSNGDGHVEGD